MCTVCEQHFWKCFINTDCWGRSAKRKDLIYLNILNKHSYQPHMACTHKKPCYEIVKVKFCFKRNWDASEIEHVGNMISNEIVKPIKTLIYLCIHGTRLKNQHWIAVIFRSSGRTSLKTDTILLYHSIMPGKSLCAHTQLINASHQS